ncbi:class I SAM-dependent methyltransferase [Nocardia sp. NPDC052566]|uniref:class I SAM-dependent methyltransferase n=1 Tax=Nocardia sp. NPDC052566 TaxID=3364330 RepID=UPI0037C723A6
MRTEDDSWDIASSVGATALGVAAMRAEETRRPDALFRDPYAELLVSAVGTPEWIRLGRGDVQDAERAAYGPLSGLLIARTCYLDDYFETAAADGIRQIVILAAGLDARAYRLEWPSGTTVFELDQPKVLEFKADALAAHGVKPSVDRREVPVDLRRDWPTALRDNGFDATAPTAWLAEGLLRYLPADAQDRLFDNVVALSAPGSRVAANLAGGAQPALQVLADADPSDDAGVGVGVGVDMSDLWYPEEGRSDVVEWFTERGWSVSHTNPAAVLTARGREVSEQAAAVMSKHRLMTAIRPDVSP